MKSRRRPDAPEVPPPGRRGIALALALAAAVAALLAGTTDERTLGTVADEQAMLETAVALSRSGDVGIARGLIFAAHRPTGEDVSPYGLGLPLALVPAASLAEGSERSHGPAASQALLAATQDLLLVGVALAAALLARGLGGSRFAAGLAAGGAVVASPLLAYGGTLYSEPLQALLLTAALALAVGAGRRGSWRLAAAAGLLAGASVFVKPLNLAVAPFTLAPLLPFAKDEARGRLRLLLAAAAGSAVTLGAWLVSEIVRFGRPLSSYGDQRFTNPPLDGLWRLLVGPNKGLLLYFPLLLLAAFGVARLFRARETRGAALGIVGASGSLLLISSAWWAWDGTVGWGPRLLLPAVPLLAAAAGCAADAGRGPRIAGLSLAALGLGVNLLGALVPECVASAYLDSTGPVAVDAALARRLPPSFLSPGPGGELLASRSLAAPRDAAFSPLRTHLFLLRAQLAGKSRQEVADRLVNPPWAAAHPEAIPRVVPLTRVATTQGVWANAMTAPFAWPRIGRVLTMGEEERALGVYPAWQAAMANQVYRNLDLSRPSPAEAEARTLFEIEPSGFHAALLVESLRVQGKRQEAAARTEGLSARAQGSPLLLLARALLARDAGDEAQARALMAQAARLVQAPAVVRALREPMTAWPAGLHDLLIGK